jgi:hypothetical protein
MNVTTWRNTSGSTWPPTAVQTRGKHRDEEPYETFDKPGGKNVLLLCPGSGQLTFNPI